MPLPVISHGFLIAQKLHSANELHDMETVHCVLTTDTSLSHIATGFAGIYGGEMMTIISHGISMGSTRITPLDGVSPGEDFVTSSFGVVGGHTTGATILPLSCAFGVTWQSATRGKSYRGRTYMPGVVDDQVANSQTRNLTSTTATNWQTYTSAFITGLLALSPAQQLVVLSRKLGVATNVINARVNVGVVEQRRRYERVAHR